MILGAVGTWVVVLSIGPSAQRQRGEVALQVHVCLNTVEIEID